MKMKTYILFLLLAFPLVGMTQEQKRPNILVIWGDDVGMWDLSAYHRGMMGSQTPNIDRIANMYSASRKSFEDFFYMIENCSAS